MIWADLVTDKDGGMSNDHPVVWYHSVGLGWVFYSALGHQAEVFREPAHLMILESAIRRAGRLEKKR